MVMNDIRAALEAFRPELANRYRDIVTGRFNAILSALGPSFKNVYNSWTWATTFRTTVAPNVTITGTGDSRVVSLDSAKLDRNAQAYAEDTIADWEAKIISKIGDLTDAEVQHLTGHSFRITGNRGTSKVMIEQNMIINISSHGKVFNQFPARIYVDGKFTSERKYKGMAR